MMKAMILQILLVGVLGTYPAWSQEWLPTVPTPKSKDWIQLKSGEWLRGEIKVFRDLKLEFDSDELDDLVLDWQDITALRSPRVLTWVFVGNRVVTGVGSMQDGVISVSADEETVEFPRGELLSIIEGKLGEIDYWSVKANFGFTGRSGNTNQADLNTIVKIRREAIRSRFDINYVSNLGELEGEQTIDNNRLNADSNVYVSKTAFVTLLSYEYYQDRFQNVDYRMTVSTGGGYYFFRRSDFEWFIQLSGGYQVTRYLSVEAGENQKDESGSIIPVTKFDKDITSDIELSIDISSQIGVPDTRSTTHHAIALFSIDFFRDIFELTSSLEWTRVESPKPAADGSVPKRDDFRTAIGFGVDL